MMDQGVPNSPKALGMVAWIITAPLMLASAMFERPLIVAGGVTAFAVLALFFMFRGERVTGKRPSWASLLYLLFAGASMLR
jgi:hypothetical protein